MYLIVLLQGTVLMVVVLLVVVWEVLFPLQEVVLVYLIVLLQGTVLMIKVVVLMVVEVFTYNLGEFFSCVAVLVVTIHKIYMLNRRYFCSTISITT